MSGNILDIRDFRKIDIVESIRKGNRTWDLLLTINGVPFRIHDLKIPNINREQLEISYIGFTHEPQENTEAKCMFCGQKLTEEECPKLNQEMPTLFFEKMIGQIEKDIGFSELILSDVDVNKPLKDYQNKNEPVEVKAAGISQEGTMLFVMEYKGQLVMLKEFIGEGAEYTVPTVLFEGDEGNELFVHLEFLMPENFANLLLKMEEFLNKEDEKKEIFDIMGLEDMEFWQFAKKREEEK